MKNDTINLVLWKRMTTAERDAFSRPTRATSSSHSLWNLNRTEITTYLRKIITFSQTQPGYVTKTLDNDLVSCSPSAKLELLFLLRLPKLSEDLNGNLMKSFQLVVICTSLHWCALHHKVRYKASPHLTDS